MACRGTALLYFTQVLRLHDHSGHMPLSKELLTKLFKRLLNLQRLYRNEIIIIWLYSPIRALTSLFWGFLTMTFLRGWIVSPVPNPQPGGPGLRIYDPRGQGGPATPPGTGYQF
jgi:hypothetical protein